MALTPDVTELYQRHRPKMVAFARRYVADQSVAEDVVEELLQHWIERPPHLQDGERVTAFLSVSVYHAAIDWLRRERAEQGLAPRGDLTSGAASVDRRRAAPVGVLGDESRDALQARLNAALERMKSSDRLLLETHYGQALTAAECMELLGINRAAFDQRLHRARIRLLNLLEAT